MITAFIFRLLWKLIKYLYRRYKKNLLKYRRLSRYIAVFTRMYIPAEHIRERPWLSTVLITRHLENEVYYTAMFLHYKLIPFYDTVKNHKLAWCKDKLIDLIALIIYMIEIIFSYRLYWYNIALVIYYTARAVYAFIDDNLVPMLWAILSYTPFAMHHALISKWRMPFVKSRLIFSVNFKKRIRVIKKWLNF